MNPYHNRLKNLMSKTRPSTTYFFSQSEHEILRSLSAYMVGVPRDTMSDVPIITIDTFIKQLPKTLRRQLRFGLHLFQWGPLLFMGKTRHFTQLDPLDAERYIETWANSRFRIRRKLFRGLRDIAFLGYYSSR